METICTKFQILFSVKNKENVTNLSSAELAQSGKGLNISIIKGFSLYAVRKMALMNKDCSDHTAFLNSLRPT